MTNKTPSGAEKYHESTKPESSKTAKMFFLLPSSSDRLAQYCMNSQWFIHETEAFYTEQCTTPCFCITSKSCKALVATHSKTMASTLGRHFLHLYVCMRTSGSP